MTLLEVVVTLLDIVMTLLNIVVTLLDLVVALPGHVITLLDLVVTALYYILLMIFLFPCLYIPGMTFTVPQVWCRTSFSHMT